jgi:hypothetical protein
VTATGRIAWQTALATHGTTPAEAISPLPTTPVAVFAQDGMVHGLRLTDGHPPWPGPAADRLRDVALGGLVAVLTGQVRHARITGLTRRPARCGGCCGCQRPAGMWWPLGRWLAMIRSMGVQVVSLTDGKVRWARFGYRWPARRLPTAW